MSLAREVVWRTRNGWRKKRLLAQIERSHCPVRFRTLPYYAHGIPNLSETSKALITGYADQIGVGHFPFLGYGTQPLGREPRWNVDFVSGMEWPSTETSSYVGISQEKSDIKVPWELSRLQFLPILGKAYVITGNERYREDAKRLTLDWIIKNPVGLGVNWTIAMEAALRAMSICFLLNLLFPLRPEEQDWLGSVTRTLWHHLLYIEAHTEFSHLIRSNHYLSNVIGLYCLSEFLDGAGMPARRQLYRRRVESEILNQVYEDGGDYEASTGYHVLVTQMFTSALLLMRATTVPPEPRFLQRLRQMYMLMQALASDSGQLPHVGDCDDGRVELLLDDLQQMLTLPVEERNSLRISNLLGVGKCLFGGTRGSLEDAKWYALREPNPTGSSGVQDADSCREELAIFPHSGMGIARARHSEVLFFAVPNGISGKGSHNHNDKLSFVLRLDGEEVLCDSGTCTYTRNPEIRNRFRATSAHNTVIVDGQEQNRIDTGRAGLFYLGTEAKVSPIVHITENEEFSLRASHSGYRRLGITHTRTIRLHAAQPTMVIDDDLTGEGTHRFEINFQLAPGWQINSIENLDSHVRVCMSGTRELEIVVQSPHRVYGEKEESMVSMTYGATTPSARLRIWGESAFPVKLNTTVSWKNELCRATDMKEAALSHVQGA